MMLVKSLSVVLAFSLAACVVVDDDGEGEGGSGEGAGSNETTGGSTAPGTPACNHEA